MKSKQQSRPINMLANAFFCGECGEPFDREVWHCHHCGHHWLPGDDDQCRNCYHPKEENIT